MLLHLDVDKYLNQLLSGEKSPLSVTPKTVKSIKNKDRITVISIKSQSQITRGVLNNFPQLKFIISRTVGCDHIDLTACKEKGVAVYNIPNYGAESVAQYTIALLLCGARKIVSANFDTHKGNFSYTNFLGLSLSGKTFGVIGTGRIGLEVVKIATSLGMKIIAFDMFKNEQAAKELGYVYVSLNRLLKQSDVVTLHLPSTPETRHILNNKTIPLIKKGAILVNTARGDLIDTKTLIKYVDKFHAVCLDVLEDEAHFSQTHPLLKFPNVIITPHCAFYSDVSIQVIACETARLIANFRKGSEDGKVV